jgi:nitrogen fixation protein NifU and related proteins
MASLMDPDSKKKQYVFGQCNGQSVANLAGAPILAQIPLDSMISKFCDSGNVEDIVLDEEPDMMETFFESIENIEKAEPLIQTGNTEDGPIIIGQQNHSQSSFSDVVLGLIRAKDNMGVLDEPDAQGYFLGSCGDRMQIDLRLSDRKIQEAKFLADGCGATIACGSMITKMACSKTLDAANLITQEELLSALDGLPEDHIHCAELAVMILREAVIDAIEGHGKLKRKDHG